MKLTALTLALLLAVGSPALALSCLRPDVSRAFDQAQHAEDLYIVVLGQLEFDERKLQSTNGTDSPELTEISAQMTGHSLSNAGFSTMFDREITLQVPCYGPWCGGARSGTVYLAFLKRESAGYVLTADPCATLLFAQPTPQTIQTVTACFRNQGCR